jgi:hypothetical protein
MAITTEEKDFLNNRFGKLANKVQLGTLIENAEDVAPADGSVTLAKLASGVTPSHVVKYAGSFTTLGGDASESITVAGVVATDVALVTVKTAGATPRSVVAAAAGTNAIAVTMSGDPSTDHVLHYVVFRAAS